MRCEICNKLLSENSQYCPFCGSKVEPIAQESANSSRGAYFNTTDETYSLAFLEEVLEKQKEAKKQKRSMLKEEPQRTVQEPHAVNEMILTEQQVANPGTKRKFPILPILLGAALVISIALHIFQFVSYNDKNSPGAENEWFSQDPKVLEKLLTDEYDRGHKEGYQAGFGEGYSLGYGEASGSQTVNIPTRTPATRTPSTRTPATKTPSTPAPATQPPNTDTKKEEKKCSYTGCDNSPLSNIAYCSRHKCVKENCHNPIANDYSGYCANHKCSIPRCDSPRVWNSIFCDQHGD